MKIFFEGQIAYVNFLKTFIFFLLLVSLLQDQWKNRILLVFLKFYIILNGFILYISIVENVNFYNLYRDNIRFIPNLKS